MWWILPLPITMLGENTDSVGAQSTEAQPQLKVVERLCLGSVEPSFEGSQRGRTGTLQVEGKP